VTASRTQSPSPAGRALAGAISLAIFATPAAARDIVNASAPEHLAVTLYRDPNRGVGQTMNRDWPRGFAMVSETRRVTLPPGESTIRFEGVAEGMATVTAIVTGLPGGTIEKNRNADLLSPASLVDGTLGNRVTVTRTNPATGKERSESAIVRTRADGGLVLQTSAGYEAVRCSGLPEKLSFDHVPARLSAQPVFTVDTRDAKGGTYSVTLTYLAWGFDWQAHYVATVDEGHAGPDMRLELMSWLTLLNDNGQSFPDAELMAVAGRLKVTSDYQALGKSPDAEPLRLVCYPLGHTATGSPIVVPVPSPAPPQALMEAGSLVVTGSRTVTVQDIARLPRFKAIEEALGDLKLYRLPERVTVAAKGLKQVAFLDKDAVRGKLVYQADCNWRSGDDGPVAAEMRFETVNDEKHGLGVAMPMGGITFFEPSPRGELFVGEQQLRDYASGQDVEIPLGESSQVFSACERTGKADPGKDWAGMKTTLGNANPHSVTLRLKLGSPLQWQVRGLKATRVKDGETVYEVSVPANGKREIAWEIRRANSAG
jgi:hypothetical protein